jgi:uncharacterized protein YbgA (DUF1722 family)/uncharacterized protein YbbK (DUF523 family)
MTSTGAIRIGISSCLLGKKVRYDGGHKRDDFLVDTFGGYVTWVPVCPEVEIGLGTPRDVIRLVGSPKHPTMLVPRTGVDLTAKMRGYAERRVGALAADGLCGYVLKKDSPSCGMERVKVYDGQGSPSRTGVGLFARALLDRLPNLPVEEEGRLQDPALRENFVERVFAYRRLRTLFSGRWSVGALVEFHTRHKFLLLSHSPSAYSALGRIVAGANGAPRGELAQRYESGFMAALKKPATRGLHTNVLQHLAGYFKKSLNAESKAELDAEIQDYRMGHVPLLVPITLIRHYVRLFKVEYLAGQVYLDPHPKELMLRNHV